MSGNTEQALNSIRRLLGQANVLLEGIVATPESVGSSTARAVGNSNSLSTPAIPDRDGERPGQSSAIRTLSAVRTLFAPYADSRSSAVRTATRRGAPPREWIKRFVCLSSQINPRVPTPVRMVYLQEEGLGEQIINTVRSCDSNQLSNLLWQKYPKLSGMDFVLMRTVGSGAGKPLTRLNPTVDVPGVTELCSYRGTIFVCPKGEIRMEGDSEATTSDHVTLEETETGLPDVNIEEDCDISTDINNYCSTKASGGAEQVVAADAGMLEPMSELITMEDFQRHIYEKNPGFQYIAVLREDFINQVIGVYKDPNFDLLKQPQIFFLWEQGRDVGGLTREFFYKCFTSLLNNRVDGRFPVFEGSDDHKVPSKDSLLLHTGFFRMLGKLMLHSLIHTGVAFIGLSSAFVEYLLTKNLNSMTPIRINLEDIPSFEIQQIVIKLEAWTENDPLSRQDYSDIKEAATLAEYSGSIDFENRHTIKELIKMYNVIDSRKSALSEIKAAFESKPEVFDFICARPYLWDAIFPKMSGVTYTPIQVLNHIDFVGDNVDPIREALTGLLQQLHETGKIKDLISCWTSWPILPEEKLILKVQHNCDFQISTCFFTMTVPSSFSANTFLNFVQMSMANDVGFGLV